MLGLENGIVNVSSGKKLKFDNNSLLCLNKDKGNEDILEMKIGLGRKDTVKDLMVNWCLNIFFIKFNFFYVNSSKINSVKFV